MRKAVNCAVCKTDIMGILFKNSPNAFNFFFFLSLRLKIRNYQDIGL